MTNLAEFVQEFREFLGRHGRSPDLTPWALVEGWEEFVDGLVEDGYDWCIDDFSSDLFARDLFEEMFNDERLRRFELPIVPMRERVTATDEKPRQLFLPDVQLSPPDWPWWRRGILSNGRGLYAADTAAWRRDQPADDAGA